MSFLSPSVLWGLLAASIPIIIHLISTRRTQKVDFSTLRFIKALEHDAIRNLKLRQWLLVFLRTLAVLLLILVFARPVKVGYFPAWAAGDRTTRMVFLLDNSGSMSALFQDESLLERSKGILKEIVQGAEGRITVDIFQTTPFEKRFSGEFLSEDQIEGVLSDIRGSSGRDNLWDAIEKISNRMVQENSGMGEVANQEFYILSDFPGPVPSSLKDEAGSVVRYYLFTQPEIEGNLSILSVEVLSQLRLLNHLVSVGASVENQGEELRKNVPIQLYFEGDRVGQAVSDLSPLASKDFVFQAFAPHTGSVRGTVEIPEDEYELDNHKFFQFSIPPRIQCKVVGPSKDQLSLLRVGLSSISQDSLFVEFDVKDSYGVSALSLETTDVLILVDPGNLNAVMAEEISRFAREGGSILAFLGTRYSDSMDPSLLKSLTLPEPRGVTSLTDGSFFEVTDFEKNHPLFRNFPAMDLAEEMPRIFSHVRTERSRRSRAIMSLSDGEPLLVETKTPSMKMLTFTALPNLRWTDLPVRGFFVPFLHRMLVYLATRESQTTSVEVGQELTVSLGREFISGQLEIVSPTGKRTKLVPDYQRELLKVDEVDEAGVYRLLSNGQEVFSFVANVPPVESPTGRVPVEELSHIFPSDRTRLVRWSEDALTAVVEARRGTELWRLFLIAAVVVLAAETWIGRVKQEKGKP